MQKFHKGARVHIAKDLGKAMFHFTADRNATVLGSYADLYGGSRSNPDGSPKRDVYALDIDGCGGESWYEEWQLTLIAKTP